MNQAGRLFFLGPKRLLNPFFEDVENLAPLRLLHLWSLNPNDIVVTSRPWVLLFEFLLLFRPSCRPFLIQVADGIIFPLNCKKKTNRRYGGLYRRIFADILVVRQNLQDRHAFTNDTECVHSIIQVESRRCDVSVSLTSAVILSGNDPFFDFQEDAVTQEFVRVAIQLKDLGIRQILFSCPNAKLERSVLRLTEEGIIPIGRLANFQDELEDSVFVGSPSTVLLDKHLDGRACILISLFRDDVWDSYVSPQVVLETATRQAHTLGLRVLMSQGRAACEKISLLDLTKSLEKRALNISKQEFFKNFRLRLLVREIQLLTFGSN
jgi:hypothetical protein